MKHEVSEGLETVLTFAQAEGRVCPQPQAWKAVWDLLPDRSQVGAGWEPPLPLILAAWWHSSDGEKRERFLGHIRWAAEHGALGEVDAFLRSLPAAQWHHESD